jgi:TatD DNase family protein
MAASVSVATASGASRLRFIDIGVNLTDAVFTGVYHGKRHHDDDFKDVLQRAKRHGVTSMLITGGNLEESRHAVELARKHGLFCTVGCHPTRCNEFLTKAATPEAYLAALDELIGNNLDVVKAVGECGLDYDRLMFCKADVQRRFFPWHFQLAAKYKLPMFLHDRNTGEDFVNILAEHADVLRQCGGGVVHSFTGSVGELRALLRHPDVYVGINGCSMKTDENLRALAEIPLDRLMLETDAPWCDIRPTHASFEFRWPRQALAAAAAPAAAGNAAGKKAGGKAPAGGGSAKKQDLTPLQARLATYAAELLLPEDVTVKGPEKHQAGCMVKGRNEPANIVPVFEVLFALRHSEVKDPVELAELIHATTTRVFRFPA